MIISGALRRAVAGVLAAGFTVATALVSTPASAEQAASSCRYVERTVALTEGAPPAATISATLCVPATWSASGRQVDVLVHGGSYNRSYWNWPQGDGKYSYVRRALADGRATFAYDRLGVGESSRPPSTRVSVGTDAYVLHQLVRGLRADYPTINVVTHSIGGLVGIEEAARFGDIDRLVVTGMLHGTGVGIGGLRTFTNFYPAMLDPVVSADTADVGWVTTLPGTRDDVFFHPPAADPAVIAYDEAHKDVTTELTLATSALVNKLPPALNSTSRVRVPVLVMVGEHDALFCGLLLDCRDRQAVQQSEAAFYPRAASLTILTVPDTGHNLALHRSSNITHSTVSEWLHSA